MNRDKRTLYISAYSVLALLFLALLMPVKNSALLCAVLLAVSAWAVWCLIKKRAVHSHNKRQVTALMALIGFMYVVLFYMSALVFGLVPSEHALTLKAFFVYVLPIAVVIIASELLRTLILAQNSRQASVVVYIICVIAEVLTVSALPRIDSFNKFMDVLALTLMPAIISNLLYQYLCRRYGAFPSIAYRLFVTLFAYIIPFSSAIPDAIYALAKLLIPLLIYIFIDVLYEKKKKHALQKKSVISYIAMGLMMLCAIGIVMLMSCRFRFCALVIGSESMTGEINMGDMIVYEEYGGETVAVGDVLAFEKNGTTVIHRVVDIEIINGETRYTTKGDANEDTDGGYITQANIVGTVKFKIPAVGYPTIWLRGMFEN